MPTIDDDDGIMVASGIDDRDGFGVDPVVSTVPLDFLRLRNHEDGDDVAAVVVAEMCS